VPKLDRIRAAIGFSPRYKLDEIILAVAKEGGVKTEDVR
jgi:hypothetical protein